jgi:MATE family multidrug resistance protein
MIFKRLAGPLRVRWRVLLAPEPLRQLWQVNRDIFIRTLGLMGGFAWFTAQGAQFGKVILAANAVLFNLQLVMSYALDGFAHAAEVLVGEAMARPDGKTDLRAALKTTMGISAAVALAFALTWALVGPWTIDRLTDLADVRAAARVYLPWAVALPLVSVWCFQLDGICVGAMRTRAMRDGMIIALGGFIGLGLLSMPGMGNHGLWMAFMFFFALRGITLAPTLWRLVR